MVMSMCRVKQTLGGHKQKLVGARTQEKGAVTPEETDPDLPVSVQESLVEVEVTVACFSFGGTVCSPASMGPFEGGYHYLHYLHHSLKVKLKLLSCVRLFATPWTVAY